MQVFVTWVYCVMLTFGGTIDPVTQVVSLVPPLKYFWRFLELCLGNFLVACLYQFTYLMSPTFLTAVCFVALCSKGFVSSHCDKSGTTGLDPRDVFLPVSTAHLPGFGECGKAD